MKNARVGLEALNPAHSAAFDLAVVSVFDQIEVAPRFGVRLVDTGILLPVNRSSNPAVQNATIFA